MKTFLETIASAYGSRYTDLSQFCFVFPGRRSGSFFCKYLGSSAAGKPMLAPQTVTITDVMDSLSGRIADNRIDLLFLLFNCYAEILGGEAREKLNFDDFRPWGETVLSDFNDVDTHLADPDELFKNLADLNEISTDFLTEDQREVMEQYFGIEAPAEKAGQFWKNFNNAKSGEEGVKGKFLYLWQTLAPLYHKFNERLAAEGLSYPGSAARLALRNVEEKGRDALSPLKMVFVGFNVLSAVEWKLFSLLKQMTTVIDGREEPYADFVWDLTGIVMRDDFNSASRFVRRGIKNFPKPEWLSLDGCETSGIPEEVKVISTPSNAIQAKVAGAEIGKLHRKLSDSQFDDARVAVVLPDENLLMPMVYSLPEAINSVNLTMGLPLRHTPVVSFVSLLRHLQSRAQTSAIGEQFFHQDVDALLAHPFTHLLLGQERLMRIKGHVQKDRRRFVYASLLNGNEESAKIFRRLDHNATCGEVIDYIDSLLADVAAASVRAAAADDTAHEQSLSLDNLTSVHIDCYRRALERLRYACRQRGINPQMKSVFTLADRLIAGEKVLFEGEPLRGLQIMGLLETRSIDFDHIIIPSMNERIFPRRMRSRTFIPASLRTAFGLPTPQSQESIFAYYFYRLISRARSVTLLYDARTVGSSAGDPSRFILQLKHLYAKEGINIVQAHFNLAQPSQPQEIVIEKDERIMGIIREFTEPINDYGYPIDRSKKSRTFSASSLQKYFGCPLQFYFTCLPGVKIEEPPTEFLSAIDFGNVVHDAMMCLYLDEDERNRWLVGGKKLSQEFFENLLNDKSSAIPDQVRRSINEKYLNRKDHLDAPLTGEPAIQHSIITPIVRDIVEMDSKLTDLHILDCEEKNYLSFKVDDELTVNFNFIIDRIDRITEEGQTVYEEGQTVYRIVDYKTGSVSLVADAVDDIFNCDDNTKYFFQLMLYCLLAHKSKKMSHIAEFKPLIYDVLGRQQVSPKFGTARNRKEVTVDHFKYETETETCDLLDDFEAVLKARLKELFDPSKPLTQTTNTANCKYCKFRAICRC